MTKDELNSVIFTVTQSILSLVIVIGAGWFLNTYPDSAAANGVIGFVGVVLAFYFSQAISNNATSNAIKMQAETKKP